MDLVENSKNHEKSGKTNVGSPFCMMGNFTKFLRILRSKMNATRPHVVRAPSKHVAKTKNRSGPEQTCSENRRGNTVSPKGNMISAKGNMISAKGNMLSAKGNMVFSKGNVISPRENTVFHKGNMFSAKQNCQKNAYVRFRYGLRHRNTVFPKGNMIYGPRRKLKKSRKIREKKCRRREK